MVNPMEEDANGNASSVVSDILGKLTPRQQEVLGALCEGLSNKQIARQLRISSGTVKVHVVHILRSLRASSRLEAVVIAQNAGFNSSHAQLQRARVAVDVPREHVQPVVMALKVGLPSPPPIVAVMSRRLDVATEA